MRKLLAIVLATAFGISAGLGSSTLRRRVYAIPYCLVARNPDWYHGRAVRVKARLIFSGEEMSVFEKCDPVEALIAKVQPPDQSSTSGSVWGALVYTGVEADLKTAEAIIEGEFNGRFSNGCWGPKYHITARSIELTSVVKDYVPPAAEDSATRVKH